MALFFPDIVLTDDRAGFGMWLAGHYFEHQQFNTLGLAHSPQFVFPVWDLFSWDYDSQENQKVWIEQHSVIHDALRASLNVGGIDLADIDWKNDQAVQTWMQYHATEHGQMRTAFGVN